MLLMCILVKDEVTAFLHYFTRKWIHACNRPGMGAIKIANIVVIVKKVWTCCRQKMMMKEKNTTRTSIKSNCSVLPNNVRLILKSK